MPTVWTAEAEDVPNGRRFNISCDDQPLPFRSYFNLLESNEEFASWYTELLREAGYEAFFWEHPPVRESTADQATEFVLLESAALAGLRPDPRAFDSYFGADNEIVSFRSLGGDALLIAPSPCEPPAVCAHLAVFLRQAPNASVTSLWRETGKLMRESLGENNTWLSTSGLGVSWLHIRLDSYPKYYQHRAYADSHRPFGLR